MELESYQRVASVSMVSDGCVMVEKHKDTSLLALKMEDTSQEIQVAFRSWRRQRYSSPTAFRRKPPC